MPYHRIAGMSPPSHMGLSYVTLLSILDLTALLTPRPPSVEWMTPPTGLPSTPEPGLWLSCPGDEPQRLDP